MSNLNPKRYVSRRFSIPFYDTVDNNSKLKLRVSKIHNVQNESDELKDKALRHYLDHFFPEFYPLRIDPDFFQEKLPPTADVDTIESVMADIKSSLNIDNYFNTSPPSNKSIAIFSTSYNFAGTRDSLESTGKMPSYEESLAFFLEEESFSTPTSETTLVIADMGSTNNSFNDGMNAYNQQLQGFEGQLNINIDFSFLQTDIQKFLNALVADLVRNLRRNGTNPAFTEADTLTLQFGTWRRSLAADSAAIVGVEYLLVEESIASQPAKVGTFSNMLYNRIFRDPLSIATLKNYQNIVESVQNGPLQPGMIQNFLSTAGDPTGGSFLDFLEDPATIDALGNPVMIDDISNFDPSFNLGNTPMSGSVNDIQNEFIKVAYEEGLLSAANLEALENGFTEFFKSKEMERIKAQISQNPKLYRRVFEKTKAKVITKARTALSTVNDVLLNGPLGLFDKKNPAVGKLFRALGVDQLMKEVILCATFGLNHEASRITQALGNALAKEGLSIYYQAPEVPQPPVYAIPKIDLELFKPRLKAGDISKMIKNILVDTVQEMALGIIESLAELLKEVCAFNNPNSTDFGAVDIAALLPSPNTPIAGGESQLDQLAAINNLTTEELRTYVGDLSTILSSVDVCTLFINRDSASPDLIAKIIDFNEDYDNEFIKTNLATPSSLMGFFSDLSKFVDVTDICEEIANTAYLLNQDNVCLIFDDADLLDNLLNRLEMPEPNFECPDKANYINDPTISIAVPETFNALVETVEIQFISAADSLKEILLEPVLIRGAESNVLTSADSTALLGRPVQSTGSLESLDPMVLNTITGVFEGIGAAASDLQDAFENCEVNPAEVLGFDAAAAVEAAAVLTETLMTAMQDSEFQDAISNMGNTLNEIASSAGPGQDGNLAPAVVTYKFNQEYYNAFRTYIQPLKAHYQDSPPEYRYDAPVYFESYRTMTSAGSVADAANTAMFSDVDTATTDYVPLHLKFNFPAAPATGISKNNPPQEYISIEYPRFGASKPIKFDFASKSKLILDETLIQSFDTTDDLYEENFEDISPPHYTNAYVDRFVQSYLDSPLIQQQFLQGTAESQQIYRQDVEAHEFPKAYAALTESIFEYIVDNGCFDAATLQSLNLFHLNNGCPPEEVADLLDVRGIIKQMTDEYAEAACNATQKVPIRTRVRDVIKFGLYLLLIQMHIADFIIKNIFVFSAFTIDSLLEDRTGYLFKFFRSQVMTSLISYLDSMNVSVAEESIFRINLAEYFNRKVRRQSVVRNGGIHFTWGTNDLVFPVGTSFSATDDSPLIGFDEIIDYLIVERLNHARIPVNNAIKKALPNNRPIELTKAILTAMPVLTAPTENTAPGPTQIRAAAQIAFLNTPTVFILSRRLPTNSAFIFTRVFSMWFYDGMTGTIEGETNEEAPELNQIGSGDVVKLIDALYSVTESEPAPDPFSNLATGMAGDDESGQYGTGFEDTWDGAPDSTTWTGTGTIAERLEGLSGNNLRNEIAATIREMYTLPGPETDSGAFGLTAAVATVAWVMGGGYESSPRIGGLWTGATSTWSDSTTPTTSEAAALAILAGIVVNGSFVWSNKGEESVEYQLWRLGILPEDHFDPPEPVLGYQHSRQKDYWYENIPDHMRLSRLLSLIGYELGQESIDLTNAWLEAQYYTDNWPQNPGGGTDDVSLDRYSDSGFPVDTRPEAVDRLIQVTKYWIPDTRVDEWGQPVDPDGTSMHPYMRTTWRSLGIISPDTPVERNY